MLCLFDVTKPRQATETTFSATQYNEEIDLAVSNQVQQIEKIARPGDSLQSLSCKKSTIEQNIGGICELISFMHKQEFNSTFDKLQTKSTKDSLPVNINYKNANFCENESLNGVAVNPINSSNIGKLEIDVSEIDGFSSCGDSLDLFNDIDELIGIEDTNPLKTMVKNDHSTVDSINRISGVLETVNMSYSGQFEMGFSDVYPKNESFCISSDMSGSLGICKIPNQKNKKTYLKNGIKLSGYPKLGLEPTTCAVWCLLCEMAKKNIENGNDRNITRSEIQQDTTIQRLRELVCIYGGKRTSNLDRSRVGCCLRQLFNPLDITPRKLTKSVITTPVRGEYRVMVYIEDMASVIYKK
jgi:hypothetical protein